MDKRRLVMFSGGAASYVAAKRCVAKYGKRNVELLFCDTMYEDEDTYRFLREAARGLGVYLQTIADGRNIWQVFHDERFLGNSRVDLCSRILKREPAQRFVESHFTPESVVKVIGYDWTEGHRMDDYLELSRPFDVEWPLQDKPLLDKCEMLEILKADGIEPPRLYTLGAKHNNCGGGCVKAGQAHWAWLWNVLPNVYAVWEREESAIRTYLQKDVAILTDRRGGNKKPMTLKAFRLRLEAGESFDTEDWGACSCFATSA